MRSCLPDVICDLLRNGSLLDIGGRAPLYTALFDLMAMLAGHVGMGGLLLVPAGRATAGKAAALAGPDRGAAGQDGASAVQLLFALDQQSQFLLKCMPQVPKDEEVFLQIARSIHNIYEKVCWAY